ncbi:hypothetical protein CYMTET_14393 [Cymbomonas tetramitiformis]|uniref:Uncharacterized protein n=1 Tax=Cymbomonas tetramitiformis TaxID=36881 RepID=A0AAE0GHL3_9CHLO|nr:hypothetical protein CYMTET_14393 [Cymbomonas tetramitiformis]
MPPRKKSQRDRFEELVRKNADVLDEATLAKCTKTAIQPVTAVHTGTGNATTADAQAEAAIDPSVAAAKQTGEPPLRWPSWSEGAILQDISGSAAIRTHFRECMVGEVQSTGTSNKEKLSASQVLKVEYDALMLEMGVEERSVSPPSSSRNGEALELGTLNLEDYDVVFQDEVLKGSLSEKTLNEAISVGKPPVRKHTPRPVWGANLPPTNPVGKPSRTRPSSSRPVRSAQQDATLPRRPVSATVTSQRAAPAKPTTLSSVLKEVAAQVLPFTVSAVKQVVFVEQLYVSYFPYLESCTVTTQIFPRAAQQSISASRRVLASTDTAPSILASTNTCEKNATTPTNTLPTVLVSNYTFLSVIART